MSAQKKIGIGAYFVLLIWFHQLGLLILAFPLAYLLVRKIGDRDFIYTLGYTVKFLFVVFLIASPLWIYSQLAIGVSSSSTNFGKLFAPTYGDDWRVFYWIANPLTDPVEFLRNVFGNLIGTRHLYFLLLGVFFPFVINYKDRAKQISFLIITVFLPIGLILLLAVVKQYFFIQRQFIWVMPFFALFLGMSWESLYRYIFRKDNRV